MYLEKTRKELMDNYKSYYSEAHERMLTYAEKEEIAPESLNICNFMILDRLLLMGYFLCKYDESPVGIPDWNEFSLAGYYLFTYDQPIAAFRKCKNDMNENHPIDYCDINLYKPAIKILSTLSASDVYIPYAL